MPVIVNVCFGVPQALSNIQMWVAVFIPKTGHWAVVDDCVRITGSSFAVSRMSCLPSRFASKSPKRTYWSGCLATERKSD